MARLVGVLTVITFIAALGLGFVYQKTAPKIEQQKQITDELAMRTALPEAACGVFVECHADSLVYYEGYRYADTTGFVGYVVRAAGRGYSSTIETMVGVDPYGRITGLKITHEQETPGLGTRIEEVKSTKTVLDAIKELMGKGKPPRVAIDISDTTGSVCLEVGIADPNACACLDTLVASEDTTEVMRIVPQAFSMAPKDSAVYLCKPPLAFEVAKKVMEKLREQQTPWFLQQFIGKRKANLLVVAEKTDTYIQAITGATISSAAVTSSVREAIAKLEKAIGGFKEEKP